MVATTLNGVMLTGNHASRPAASAVAKGALYACSTHGLIYQSDTSSWTTWATLGTAASGSITASGYTQNTAKLLGRTTASSGAIEEITVGTGLTLSAGSLTASGASASSAEPLEPASASGSPDDEFVTTSSAPITGWTTLGSLAAIDGNTTKAGHAYMRITSTNATRIDGMYKSYTMSNGDIIMCKVYIQRILGNYNRIGLFIAESSPGKVCTVDLEYSGGATNVEGLDMTNPTTLSSQYAATNIAIAEPDRVIPMFLAIRRNSSTSYDGLWSRDGFFWTKTISAHNPGFTQATIGLFLNDGAGGGSALTALFDWIRLYTTLPGVEF